MLQEKGKGGFARAPERGSHRVGAPPINIELSSEKPARGDQQSFVAIDFETADYYRDSACQVGMAKVENGRIIDRFNMLLRPPRQQFRLSHIHGITWRDVTSAPTFEEA